MALVLAMGLSPPVRRVVVDWDGGRSWVEAVAMVMGAEMGSDRSYLVAHPQALGFTRRVVQRARDAVAEGQDPVPVANHGLGLTESARAVFDESAALRRAAALYVIDDAMVGRAASVDDDVLRLLAGLTDEVSDDGDGMPAATRLGDGETPERPGSGDLAMLLFRIRWVGDEGHAWFGQRYREVIESLSHEVHILVPALSADISSMAYPIARAASIVEERLSGGRPLPHWMRALKAARKPQGGPPRRTIMQASDLGRRYLGEHGSNWACAVVTHRVFTSRARSNIRTLPGLAFASRGAAGTSVPVRRINGFSFRPPLHASAVVLAKVSRPDGSVSVTGNGRLRDLMTQTARLACAASLVALVRASPIAVQKSKRHSESIRIVFEVEMDGDVSRRRMRFSGLSISTGRAASEVRVTTGPEYSIRAFPDF